VTAIKFCDIDAAIIALMYIGNQHWHCIGHAGHHWKDMIFAYIHEIWLCSGSDIPTDCLVCLCHILHAGGGANTSHRNDHRTSSIDCDLHKLTNTIPCKL